MLKLFSLADLLNQTPWEASSHAAINGQQYINNHPSKHYRGIKTTTMVQPHLGLDTQLPVVKMAVPDR